MVVSALPADDPAAVEAFLASLVSPRSTEAGQLMAIMGRATGASPRLWSGKFVGFGHYDYSYASGRSGTCWQTAFGMSKARIAIHVMPDLHGLDAPLERLGPHKATVSCLYVTRLARVDIAVLEEIIRTSISRLRAIYPNHSEA